MKVAFVGKGGSGKTTLAALLARRLAGPGSPGPGSPGPGSSGPGSPGPVSPGSARPGPVPVLAVDADINQHLAVALGASQEQAVLLPALGEQLTKIKEYLRGTNPRIRSVDQMIKTTPPGQGSRLLRLGEPDPLLDQLVHRIGGVDLTVTGPFASEDLGVACYHSKVGAVELLLNHLVDGPGEYLVVDMTAGADSFASGLFTRFDLTVLVCEPTLRAVSVYRQYAGYAREYGVRICVVGNKIEDESDVAFLREHIGSDLLTWLGRSAYVKDAERGKPRPIAELEPANLTALDAIREQIDLIEKDWVTYSRQAHEFHLRNARAWGSARAGVDLAEQIDPEFVLGPAALDPQ